MNIADKKALLLDLDNTIYPVSSIGDELFSPLFDLIRTNGNFKGTFESLKEAVMRIPFQKVAAMYQMDEALTEECIALLRELDYRHPMQTYPDYHYLNTLPVEKYLITTGFTNMQQSKIDQLGIRDHFRKICIIDHDKTQDSKKDVFERIQRQDRYRNEDMLVIGDDMESELQAAKQLGIDGLLYVHGGDKAAFDVPVITSFEQLQIK